MALANNVRTKIVDNFKYGIASVLAGAIHIYESALLNRNAAGDVLLSTDAASQTFAGISTEELDQAAAASAGDNFVKTISRGSGVLVRMKLTGVTKAHLGLSAYAKADDEVQLVGDATNDVLVGTIEMLDETANYCWVKI